MFAETPFRYTTPLYHHHQHHHHQSLQHHFWLPWLLGNGDMAAIPQTLQMTKAQRQQRNNSGNTAAGNTYFGMAEVDQPMRYNSKLMNSIWGHYNENSVHNFKSLQCGGMQATAMGGATALTANEAAGQTLMQPPSPSLNGSAMRRRLRELGEAVSTNFMDNLNQY